MNTPATFWDEFLVDQCLPPAYRATAERWFLPLAEAITVRHQREGKPLLVAINGSQGSGKSTLAALLCLLLSRFAGLRAVTCSIDDFYLTHAQRLELATSVNPLLVTRGVPGTHDVALMSDTLRALLSSERPVAVPRFDKARDDRCSESEWLQVVDPVDVIIWEGWCLGVTAQPEAALASPVNPLEAYEDSEGRWRQFVNEALARQYEPLFSMIDYLVMLAAPSFDCVHRWRSEQEQKLAAARHHQGSGLMNGDEIRRFIAHYQRLTEWGLRTVPERADAVFQLATDRHIAAVNYREEG